jgi:hypothetical protein
LDYASLIRLTLAGRKDHQRGVIGKDRLKGGMTKWLFPDPEKK